MAVREVFMCSKRYTEEFKIEAARQVIERGYSVAEVAGRLGMTTHGLNAWKMSKANFAIVTMGFIIIEIGDDEDGSMA